MKRVPKSQNDLWNKLLYKMHGTRNNRKTNKMAELVERIIKKNAVISARRKFNFVITII